MFEMSKMFCIPVVKYKMDMVTEEGTEADTKHGRDKEQEEDMELALA